MSLTLRGFKSFASATTFEFTPGINAVVGPNGSGKSNVLDALAWVMGEQGAKSLRGGSMKDVIFAGSGEAGSGDGAQRAPLGRAKVTLTFDNSDGALSIPADRVQISRTMFRSGGSEYEINGSPARLADIQDLLSEAGLGQQMHVLVGQGQLDAVLHATAQQRRDMIEQAAGVVKYRRRQEKTSRKLESVASNVTRLSDLVAELDSQLQPLSEQAESAATARQLQARIRQLEAVLLTRQLGILQAEQTQALASEAEGTRRADTLKEQLEAARAASAKHQQEQNRLNAEVTACQKAVSTLRESAARVRTVQSIAAERVRTYRVELTEATAAARAGYERALELLEERREEAERAVESYASFEERYDAALKNVEKAASEVAQTERASGEAAQSRARAQARLNAARAAAVEATRAYAAAAERAATLREALGQSLGEAPAELDTESAEAVFDPETGELVEPSSEAEGASLLRVLDAVQIDPEYARAASAALTSLATAVLSVPVEGAEVSQLRGDKGGESSESAAKELSTELPETTLPESCATELRELGIRPATEMIEPLSEDAAALAGIDEHALARVTAALGERLAGVLFAPDAASAEHALHMLAENPLAGQRTIWRIFDPAGTEHTRYSLLYPAEGASPLELAAAYRAAAQVVTRTRAELDEAEQAVQQAQTAAESAVEAEREAAKAAGVASAEHARARAQAESLEASAQNIQNERARLNERLTAAEESVAQARTAYESARTREDSYLAGTGEQAPAAKIERRAQRLGEVLAEQVGEHEQQLHELSGALKNAQEGLTSTNDEVQDLQAAHAAALTLLARTQTEAARVQERVQALAERARLVTGLTLEQLEEEYSEQLPVDVPADEASENDATENTASENTATETASETTEASTESVRARLKATRAELEALGAINPLALEEYEALSERHAYLNQQIEDLKATRRDLNTVMDEVSSHIAEVFTAAMEDINTHYRRIFETLFPGGEGHLELDDPSDPLNSGVEIHARPAGKKVKRLSLLSGGERSLASLALLIAIYMSRPSPFYALDEVEAALDDRNLSRLLQVIGELGERSQLIVVTHQKRTMQIAETLYGVSMRGGVSTVLSQQMEELRELL
ncbi:MULTISPECIES: chromosome segregation SMC family protein [Rothia]|uniref:chromosome segregation SMC family protein n=1 Tax=Rothia sp. HMSC065C03 TaxID=1715084 RepID=UPI0008A96812|nr:MULTISPECIES: AAA family ATPase [Rothia]OHQ19458.1 chromosome segregation protein SMC [Rothia sp. HMSC065C03]